MRSIASAVHLWLLASAIFAVGACGPQPPCRGIANCEPPACRASPTIGYKPEGPIFTFRCPVAKGAQTRLEYTCEVRHAQPGTICNGSESFEMVAAIGVREEPFVTHSGRADGKETIVEDVKGVYLLDGADTVEIRLKRSLRTGCQPGVPSDSAQVQLSCQEFKVTPL